MNMRNGLYIVEETDGMVWLASKQPNESTGNVVLDPVRGPGLCGDLCRKIWSPSICLFNRFLLNNSH